jgi:putative FmdB family regulatory protein
MPCYEFKCPSCGEVIEVQRSSFEVPEQRCDKCGADMDIVISATPALYKTAGFSITDKRGLKGYKRKPNIKIGYGKE